MSDVDGDDAAADVHVVRLLSFGFLLPQCLPAVLGIIASSSRLSNEWI